MNTLPEELLDRIVGHLAPWPEPLLRPDSAGTLYSLCRTSRTLYRVTKPHLYSHVHSRSGTMGRQFLDTVSAQPELAARVKYFSVQHTTEGCFEAVDANASIDEEEIYGAVEDTCTALLVQTLVKLPKLEALDLSRFFRQASPSDWLDSATKLVEHPSSLSTELRLFDNLRCLSVHVGERPMYDLLPFFGLPQLRSLEIDMRGREDPPDPPENDQTFPLSSLSVIGYRRSRFGQVEWLAERFPALESLLVTTVDRNTKVGRNYFFHVVQTFARHIKSGSLKNLQHVVPNLRHCEMETMATEESGDMLVRALFSAFYGATQRFEAAGDVTKGTVENPLEKFFSSVYCSSGRKILIRDLTEAEKQAYDIALLRRP